MAPVINSQNVLPTSTESSLSPPNTIFPSYTSPEEITSSRLWKKISPILKIPRKVSNEKNSNYVFFLH
jgi:hypothetical protein